MTTQTEKKVQRIKQRKQRGGEDRREFAREGGGHSLSAADGRVNTDSNNSGDGNTCSGVVRGLGGDGGHYAVTEGR